MPDAARCTAYSVASLRCVRSEHALGLHRDRHGSEWGAPSQPGAWEYGQLMSGGGYQTFNDSPEIEAIYPLADRIEAGKRFGGHVHRRRIIVLDDWEEV